MILYAQWFWHLKTPTACTNQFERSRLFRCNVFHSVWTTLLHYMPRKKWSQSDVQVLWQNTQHTAILDAEDGRFVALRVEIQRVAIIGLPRQIFCAQHPCQIQDFRTSKNMTTIESTNLWPMIRRIRAAQSWSGASNGKDIPSAAHLSWWVERHRRASKYGTILSIQ